MLMAEMPEIGTITGEQAAALTGLAPVAHDSGTLRGKRHRRGRRALRHVMFQAALVAAHQPKPGDPSRIACKAGKPHKVIINAVARKLVKRAVQPEMDSRRPDRYSC